MDSILVYGNCQCKVIADYLSEQPALKHSKINYFFVTHPIEMLNLEFVDKVDVFIYQHVKAESLVSRNPKLNLEGYTPEGLIRRMKPFVQTISIPSIYFSELYPDTYSTDEIIQKLPPFIKVDWFFNHTFNKKVFDAIHQGKTTRDIKSYFLDPHLYTDEYLDYHSRMSFGNLKTREDQNKVDISVSEFLIKHFKKKRLTWTTNHPTKFVFNYIIHEILKLLELPPDETLLDRPDKLDQDIFPILACMRRYLDLDDFEFTNRMRVNQRKFLSLEELIQFYKDVLSGKDIAREYPQETMAKRTD